jgi:phenylalanyl-tRNA synthetase alpha subunit
MNEDGNTKLGHAHPVTILVDKISKIFTGMGFDIADGRELEREWYNFDALNVAKDHLSRDMQDTFFLKLKEDERLQLQFLFSSFTFRTGIPELVLNLS